MMTGTVRISIVKWVGGAVALLARGNQIQIPPNTPLEFHLQQPLQIP